MKIVMFRSVIKVNGGDVEESNHLFPAHLLDNLHEDNADKVSAHLLDNLHEDNADKVSPNPRYKSVHHE